MRRGTVVGWNPDEHYVYELRDDKGKPFYIGKTNCPQGRLKQHSQGTGNARVTAKLASLKKPPMHIVAGPMSEADAAAEEIRRIRASKAELLNQAASRREPGKVYERHPAVTYFMTHDVKTPGI